MSNPKSVWKLNPETGTFFKEKPIKRSLPDGTPLSRMPEYRRLYHQSKYRLDDEYRETVKSRERQRRRQALGIPEPTRPMGQCEICGTTDNGKTRTGAARRLHIDHDHVTGAFRGWLCSGCNTGIGMFRDNPSLLEEAASYLRAHHEERSK